VTVAIPFRVCFPFTRPSRRSDDATLFQLCFGKRPAEELYDVRKDPHEIRNLAGQAEFAKVQKQLRAQLERWMKETGDPRATNDDDHWDNYPYYGGTGGKAAPKK